MRSRRWSRAVVAGVLASAFVPFVGGGAPAGADAPPVGAPPAARDARQPSADDVARARTLLEKAKQSEGAGKLAAPTISSTTASTTRSTAELSQVLADPTGETDARADIESAQLDVGAAGALTGRVTVRSFTDPTGADWSTTGTRAWWGLDTDGDNLTNAFLLFVNTGSGPAAGLFDPSFTSLLCYGSTASSASSRTYAAAVPIACIGNVPSVRWYAHMQYQPAPGGPVYVDEAPATTWAGPVANDAYVPPPGVKLAANTVYRFKVTGRGGVPDGGVAAVSLGVTVTQPENEGYVTVFPCGDPPLASNVNFVAGQTVANAVLAPVAGDGSVCFYTSARLHLLADVNGWFPYSAASLQPLNPSRLFDTRDGTGGVPAGVRLAAGQTLTVPITGRNGVPAFGVSAVSLNVTVTGTLGVGYVTVFPCGTPPLASNLNFVPGQTVPNAVLAPVSPNGTVCFYASQPTHLLADVNGWFGTSSAGYHALTPVRSFDTRLLGSKVPGGAWLIAQMTGVHGVPSSGVAAVALNVTVTEPEGEGYVTVYPCGARPLASNVNYVAGKTVPTLVLAPVSPDGTVCLYTSQTAHLLADVNGWFPSGSQGLQPLTPSRLFDTRG